jgi:hypothetical protein
MRTLQPKRSSCNKTLYGSQSDTLNKKNNCNHFVLNIQIIHTNIQKAENSEVCSHVCITLNMEDCQFLYTVLGNNAHGKLTVIKNSHRIKRF